MREETRGEEEVKAAIQGYNSADCDAASSMMGKKDGQGRGEMEVAVFGGTRKEEDGGEGAGGGGGWEKTWWKGGKYKG